MSKYLEFTKDGFGSTAVYNKNTKQKLGDMDYYVPWKQFVFLPAPNTIFNDECLGDIIKTLELLNADEREKK